MATLSTNATLQEAIQAKREGKIVLRDFAGRRVVVNILDMNQRTGTWFMGYTHGDYPEQMYADLDGDERFIIRSEYSRFR